MGRTQSLPKLNLDNPAVREYIFDVARMWIGDVGIDGWRLDVAHEIDPQFWWEFRRVCKAVKADCFLLGELVAGDYRRWVAPDLLDSGTDYQLYAPLYRSFNDANFFDLKAAIERSAHAEYGVYRDLILTTFLSNHDVSRIATQLDNPRHTYAAHILMLTLPGIPMIYYGDEISVLGHKDDGDFALRLPMPAPDDWPEQGENLYRVVRKLITIRRQNAC